MNDVRSNNLSLKYQRFPFSGCKDIGIRRSEFVAKICPGFNFGLLKLRKRFCKNIVDKKNQCWINNLKNFLLLCFLFVRNMINLYQKKILKVLRKKQFFSKKKIKNNCFFFAIIEKIQSNPRLILQVALQPRLLSVQNQPDE